MHRRTSCACRQVASGNRIDGLLLRLQLSRHTGSGLRPHHKSSGGSGGTKAPRLPQSKSNGTVVCRVRWERLQQLKRKQPEASSSEQNPLEEVLEDVDPDFASRPVSIAEPVRKRRRAADVLLDSNSDADSSDEDIQDNGALDWRAKQI